MTSKLLITFDSLRYDVFLAAHTPFLKSLGPWRRAWTQATYTFPAHMSFFAGKLPQALDDTDLYDSIAIRIGEGGRRRRNHELWRLDNPEAKRPARETLSGPNIVEGFRARGLATIGTGAVNWFNPVLDAGRYLSAPFEHFRFFDGPDFASHCSAEKQVDWVLDRLATVRDRPAFVFVNFGETHSRFVHEGCAWRDEPDPYGDRDACLERQRRCLEYLDRHVLAVMEAVGPCDAVLCADHGEAMGEDGLWGHGFHHPAVMEVPMLIRLADGAPA